MIGITGYTEYYLRRGKGEEKANERTNAVFFLLSTAFFFFVDQQEEEEEEETRDRRGRRKLK